MADRYWVGGTASWDSTAGTKWSTTSGGAGGAAVPTSSDNVFFDTNSTGTCTISATANCLSLNQTGHAGTITHSSGITLNVYGSLTLTSAYNAVGVGSTINFAATSTGHTITTAGNGMGNMTFNGAGGGWTLQDPLTAGATSATLTLTRGSLDLNGHNVDNFRFNISGTNTRTLSMGDSIISDCYIWDATTTTNLTFNCGTSSISMIDWELDGGGVPTTFNGGGLTYYFVQLTVGVDIGYLVINGNNTFSALTLSSQSPVGYVQLAGNQTVGVFSSVVNDTASVDPDRMTIISSVRGTQRTITATSRSTGTGFEYTSFQDIVGAGAADWDLSAIGGGCGDLSNNSGITFSTPITAYYYLNTGNFYNTSKWYLGSGGTGGAARIPLPQDTARFDAASCNAGGQTITMNYPWLPKLDFTGSDNSEALSFSTYSQFELHGDVTLASGMTVGGSGVLLFAGTGKTPTFTTNGVSITRQVSFSSHLASATISGNYSASGSLNAIACPVTTTGTVSCLNIVVSGSGSFTPGGNVTQTGTLSTSGTANISSSGYTFSGATTATFSSTGTVNLLGLTTSSTVTLTSGTLTIGASGVSCSAFSSSNSNTRTLNMGSGTWDITGTGTCWNCATTTGLTINPSTSTIKLSNTSATTKSFTGGTGKIYYDLYIDGASGNGTVTLGRANTYNKITIEPYASILWGSALVHTFNELLCLGASGQVITFSTNFAGAATLSCPTGKVINGDYLSIQNNTATGGALFYAGDNSTNVSGNTGWTFTAQPDLDNIVPLKSYLLNELIPEVGGIESPLKTYTLNEYSPTISTGANVINPLENYTLNNYVPTIATGGGAIVPLKTFTLNEYSPTIMLVDVPLSTFDIEFHTMSVASGSSSAVPFTEFDFTSFVPLISISANIFVPVKTFDIQFYSSDQLVTVPRRDFVITSGIEVASGSHTFIPLETFAFTSYVPSFVGEQPVHNVPITDFAELTFLSYTPEIASGKNIFVPVTSFEITSGISYYRIELVTCTGEPAPIQHIEDSKKLTADAYVDLFEIVLAGGGTKLYLKMNKSVDWQGNTYEGTGIKIEGVGTYSDDEVARPKLTIFNPENVFSYLVDQGLLENAKVVRIRLLKEHLDDNLPIYRRQQWFVKRVASVRRGFIGLELRDMLDGQNFLTPGRMFIPPEFPMVSLQ